jgi:hypothetical protein
MNEQGFVKYIVIIAVILAVAFFSQIGNLKGNQQTFVSDATNQAESYVSAGSDWFGANIYPKVSGEVQKRGDIIQAGVSEQKEKISETVSEKISNYFSGVAESILHPGNNNCDCSCQNSSNQ